MSAQSRRANPTFRQADLFEQPSIGPAGFRYHRDLITELEQAELIEALAALPFEPFDFHGHLGHRQVVGFGYRYDYGARRLRLAPPIPDALAPIQCKVAEAFGFASDAFQQVLINAYPPGAGIGWHRDKPQFGEVVGVSLQSPCFFRFRLKTEAGWDRLTIPLEPRSAYLMTGATRRAWERSIPPVDAHRYSITLRTLADPNAGI